jgi:biopolymer transport protein ExbB/TolQ
LPQAQVERRARKRLERCDLIARLGPILGLMGTLIPLGPGLAALGDGDIQLLSVAMRVAFDATVLGLLGGMGGFVLGRLRRRWYDELLDSMPREQEVGDESLAI